MTGARLYTTPSGVKLCPLVEVDDGRARNIVVQLRDGRFYGFVVRRGETVKGYVDRCPHAGLPLAKRLDDYLTPLGDYITCSWHGALFDIETGVCRGGPCVGATLTNWPLAVEEGWIVTSFPAEQPNSPFVP